MGGRELDPPPNSYTNTRLPLPHTQNHPHQKYYLQPPFSLPFTPQTLPHTHPPDPHPYTLPLVPPPRNDHPSPADALEGVVVDVLNLVVVEGESFKHHQAVERSLQKNIDRVVVEVEEGEFLQHRQSTRRDLCVKGVYEAS